MLKAPECVQHRNRLVATFAGKTVLLGVDDNDIFKGVDLKLQAFQSLLEAHPELHGKIVLVQVVNQARTSGRDLEELEEVREQVREMERLQEAKDAERRALEGKCRDNEEALAKERQTLEVRHSQFS